MLVSTSKFLALLALVASVAAAPASSSIATTSDAQSSNAQSSSATPTHSATTSKVRSSTATTTTPPLVANTQTNGIVTEITIGSLVKSSVSGSQVLVTSAIVETVTLFPQSVSVPSVAPFTAAPAVTTSSQAATATNVRTNGSPARIGGGMGLAAIVGVVGVVAAVL